MAPPFPPGGLNWSTVQGEWGRVQHVTVSQFSLVVWAIWDSHLGEHYGLGAKLLAVVVVEASAWTQPTWLYYHLRLQILKPQGRTVELMYAILMLPPWGRRRREPGDTTTEAAMAVTTQGMSSCPLSLLELMGSWFNGLNCSCLVRKKIFVRGYRGTPWTVGSPVVTTRPGKYRTIA
jgi:hypothetical protein